MERNSTRGRGGGGCRLARNPYHRTPTTNISIPGGNVFVGNEFGGSTVTNQAPQECNNWVAPAPHTSANTTLPPSRASVTQETVTHEIQECQRNFGKASSTQATNKAAIAKFDKYTCLKFIAIHQQSPHVIISNPLGTNRAIFLHFPAIPNN